MDFNDVGRYFAKLNEKDEVMEIWRCVAFTDCPTATFMRVVPAECAGEEPLRIHGTIGSLNVREFKRLEIGKSP